MFNTNLHSFLNLLYDLILERWFTENVVRSNAGLTAVQVLPPGYASMGQKPRIATEFHLLFSCHIRTFVLSECFATSIYSYIYLVIFIENRNVLKTHL